MTTAVSSSVAGPAGDPAALAAAAQRWAGLAQALAPAARLSGAAPAEGWSGPAATAFGTELAVQGGRIRAVAQAAGAAAEALQRYAAELAGYQQEWARASTGDPAVLLETAERLRWASAAAARRAAVAVDGATALVPPRPATAAGVAQHLQEWQSEVGLGAAESVGSLLLTAVRFRPGRVRSDPGGYAADLGEQWRGLAGAVRHPRRLAAALVDLDTWRTSPARAVGHLVPDAVAAVVTGGTASAGRRAAAATARAARSAELQSGAEAARGGLVRTVTERPGSAAEAAEGWSGRGLSLDPPTAARVSAYHRLVAGYEAELTARMHRLAERIGASLHGLEHRLKDLPSLNRKVAGTLAEQGLGSRQLPLVLERQGDTLRYTLVLPHRGYAAAVNRAALELDRAGFARTEVKNFWDRPRYHGLNTTWTDPVTGVRFEVQFHTPKTWAATVRTHPWYEDWRLPETPAEVKADLEARIRQEYAAAGVPRRVDGLTQEALPPPEPVALPVLPAAGAGAGAALVTSGAGAVRRSRHPEPR